MIFKLYALFSIFLPCAYASFILIISYIWIKIKCQKPKIASTENKLFLNIIIPFKNEEDTIEECLKSFLRQNKSQNDFKLILINDHSTDGSYKIAESYADQFIHFELINAPNNQIGKRNAINVALEYCTSDHICLTDADTIRDQFYLENLSAHVLYKNPDIAAAPVLFTLKNKANFHAFQAIEYAIGMVSSIVGFKSNLFRNASGANIYVKKLVLKQFLETTKNKTHSAGDDVFLFQYVSSLKGSISDFIYDSKCVVKTYTVSTWSQFMNQRVRWASKTFNQKDKWLAIIWGLIWSNCFMVFLHIIIGLWLYTSSAMLFLIYAVFIKIMVDQIIIMLTNSYYPIPKCNNPFIFQFYYFRYVLEVGIKSLIKRNFIWKGKKTKT